MPRSVKARNMFAVQNMCFRRDLRCVQTEPQLRASHIVILSSHSTGNKMRNLKFFAFLRQLTCQQEFAKRNVNNIVVKPGLALTTTVQGEWEKCSSGGSFIFVLCFEQDLFGASCASIYRPCCYSFVSKQSLQQRRV